MLAPSPASVEAMAWMWLAPRLRADGGDDVALRQAAGAPARRAASARHRLEVQLHAQLLGGEQQLLEHVAGARQVDQQAQGELPLHHHLLDVGQDGALLGQDAGQRGGHARAGPRPVTVTRTAVLAEAVTGTAGV